MSEDSTARLGRATWKGALTWGGYVSTPVRAYTMTRSAEPCPLKMTCPDCGAPVKTAYRCPVCEHDVAEPSRAHELGKHRYVRVPPEALEGARTSREDTLALGSLVDWNVVPAGVWRSWYVLLPQEGGEYGYEVLRRALFEARAYAVAVGPIGRAGGQWFLEGTERLIFAHLAWSAEVVKSVADFEDERAMPTGVLVKDVKNALRVLGRPAKTLELAPDAKAAVLRPAIEAAVAAGETYLDPRHREADVGSALGAAAAAVKSKAPRRRRARA